MSRGRSPGPGPRSAPGPWLVLTGPTPPRHLRLLVTDALHDLGARSVEARDGRFTTVFAAPSDPALLVGEVAAALRAVTGRHGGDLDWRWESAEAVAGQWPRNGARLRVSPRIEVETRTGGPGPDADPGPAGAGPADAGAPPGVVVGLTPGVAFGTAEHPTTRACLRALDRLVRPADRVLDVGSGSGVLAVAAALLGARRVTAVEADRASVAVLRENLALNGVEDRVTVRHGRASAARLRRSRRVDGVAANMRAEILLPLVPALAGRVGRGGWLVLSGLVADEASVAAAAARAAGLVPAGEEREGAWWTGRFLGR